MSNVSVKTTTLVLEIPTVPRIKNQRQNKNAMYNIVLQSMYETTVTYLIRLKGDSNNGPYAGLRHAIVVPPSLVLMLYILSTPGRGLVATTIA